MQTLLYVEMNLFALSILFLLFLNVTQRSEKYLPEQKLFLALLGSNALILVLDTGMWVLDGTAFPYAREMNLLVTALYYSANPLISMIWSLYADYAIYQDTVRLQKHMVPMLLPVAVIAVLSFTSIFTHQMFTISAENIYQRGPWFLVMAATCYTYLMATLIQIIRKQSRIQKQHFLPILIFAFPPFLGGILQILFYGVSLIWVCMTLSILVIFINLQNDQLYTDHLTGLYNRRQLDHYLSQRIQAYSEKSLLAGIMIDLNAFKAINDLHGHAVGDQALEDTARIMKQTFRKSDFIARYGGDEFVVIMEVRIPEDLPAAAIRFHHAVTAFNNSNARPYSIQFSLGCGFYDPLSTKTPHQFLNYLDKLMYVEKAASTTP